MLTSNRISRIFTAAALVLLLAGFSSTASAQNNGKSFKFPVSFTLNNPCLDESVNVTATIHLVSSVKEVGEDGCIRVNFHVNYQNGAGTGVTTGNSYRVISVSNQRSYNTIVCGGCTSESSITGQFIIIGEDGKEYLSHTQVELSIDICADPLQFTITDVNSFSDCD